MFKRSPIFTLVFLIGLYLCFQLVADVSAAKLVQFGDVIIPAGTIVFALTFTWRDLIHKRLGKQWAQAAILVAAIANVFMAMYFMFAVNLPPAQYWQGQEAFSSVVLVVPRITFASIIAELVSELLDTEVYHRLVTRIPERHQWARVLGSNMISLPVDSLVFGILAFAGSVPLEIMVSIAVGQIIFKALVTVVSLPLIYLVPHNYESRNVVIMNIDTVIHEEQEQRETFGRTPAFVPQRK